MLPPGGASPAHHPAPNQLFDHIQCCVHTSLIFFFLPFYVYYYILNFYTLFVIFPYNHLFLFYFCLLFQNFDSYAFVYCFEHRHYTNFNTFDGPYLALEFLKHWEF